MLRAFVWLTAWLPLPVLYALADLFLFPIAYYVVRYRRKTVHRNLANSFPEKTEHERHIIERKFYRFFADMVVETIYGMHISEKEMHHRIIFHNVEIIEAYIQRHQGCIIMLGHCGNWEWMSDMQSRFQSTDIQIFNIYRQLRSKSFDKLMLEIRSKRNCRHVEKKLILRTMIENRRNNTPVLYGMIADQKPSPKNIHYWTEFLHQDTPFLDGSEMLAKKFDYPVVYARLTCPKRGHYQCEVIPICEFPNLTAENAITEQYARLLEQNIQADPVHWLWTHNRWKHKRTL